MIVAQLPDNEEARLKDLLSYDILDTPAEADFDALVELASQICQCPISFITLLDKDRQWFKAKTGIINDSTPRDVAFCSHAILEDGTLIVEDSHKDERFADNPLVTGELNFRFYAGAPILSPTGYKLGTICLIDHKPKKLSAEEERALILLSNQVTRLLEIKRQHKIIRQQAEEVILLQQKSIKQVMEDNEQHKKEIATHLHEDFAQEIASSLMYLDSAESAPAESLSLIQKTKEQLNTTLGKIRELSNVITPLSIDWLSPEDTIAEFVERTASTFPFRIKLKKGTSSSPLQSDITIAAIRVLEHWLKVLSTKKDIHKVSIAVAVNDLFELQVEDDGPITDMEKREKEILNSTIYDKVTVYNGSLGLYLSPGNVLKIKLPLTIKEQV